MNDNSSLTPLPNNARRFWPGKTSHPLCEYCTKLGFDQFAIDSSSSTPNVTTDRLPLDLLRIIKNYKSDKCGFCSLLFDAIAAHDPFEHPAVKDHMPEDLVGQTFRQWAGELGWSQGLLGGGHPFGKSRDALKFTDSTSSNASPQVERDLTGELRKDLQFAGELAAAQASVTHAINQSIKSNNADVAGILGAVQEMIIPVMTLMNRVNEKLPAGVSIQTTGRGLFTVGVWGFGNAPNNPPLSCLCSFNLRVAEAHSSGTGAEFPRYGNRLEDKIDVKGLCRAFLDNCINHHWSCNRPGWSIHLKKPEGPHFRLIDVYKRTIVSHDELLKRHSNTLPQYAALSYVWGETGETCRKLLESDLPEDNENGDISIDSKDKRLAATISDAIRVTQQLNEGLNETDTRLHIRYLWVDSLCIIQGPGHGQTMSARCMAAKSSQIQQMDKIYGEATIVIVAAGGSEADAGIRGVTDDRKRNPEQISRQVQPRVNVLLPVQYPSDYGKWDSRAWTLQEKLLSRRKLIFGENYASFHCQHQQVLREDMSASDAMNGPPPTDLLSPPTTDLFISAKKRYMPGQVPVIYRSPLFTEYAKVLAQYTSRELTNPKDILLGMMGLLNVLVVSNRSQKSIADRTLSGLPEQFIDLALLWQPPTAKGVDLTRRAAGDRLPIGAGQDLQHEFQFPSWSWAGWDTIRTVSSPQNHPGVRFEEPFSVSTYSDLSLRKVVMTGSDRKQEERYRPLVMWYTTKATNAPPVPQRPRNPLRSPTALAQVQSQLRSRSRRLRPVNGHGLGIAFNQSSGQSSPQALFIERALQLRGGNVGIPAIPDGVCLKDHHLICESQVATFQLKVLREPRVEVLWRMEQDNIVQEQIHHDRNQGNHQDKTRQDFEAVETHIIKEHEIRDENGIVVGHVVPTNGQQLLNDMKFNFVLLSESQYWGNENRVDVDDYPLYNVMMVEWDHSGKIASRLGLGKIRKEAWAMAKPALQTVILA
ncbi:Putative heterokaryon incompatibility [Colletotrichum destructivum]|uniref:Heterokaryon incompatibility n=1 Tax=Colletotrichum destructivum TaxID=34406 RepID=A0AAX4ICY0_9PEZI|nr:Putative heterokaryon incompatibility [Colletotrichum destructivum]